MLYFLTFSQIEETPVVISDVYGADSYLGVPNSVCELQFLTLNFITIPVIFHFKFFNSLLIILIIVIYTWIIYLRLNDVEEFVPSSGPHGVLMHLLRLSSLVSDHSQTCFTARYWERSPKSLDSCSVYRNVQIFYTQQLFSLTMLL